MIVLEDGDVDRLLPMAACIDLMREALSSLSAGRYTQSPRSVQKLPGGDLFGFMPACLGDEGYFGAKLVTAFHRNSEAGLPSHRGYVMLFEDRHGGLVAMAGAGAVTRIRTGAVSALATDLLARRDARTLALVGAGAQARSHLDAIRIVRNIERAVVYDVDAERSRRFAREAERTYGIPVVVVDSVRDAVGEADILCTLTPAAEPFLGLDMVRPGVHINAVGAFSPDKREIGSDLVVASRLYADQVDAMKRECGEYLVPVREGRIDERHILGSIGDLVLGNAIGRVSDSDITLFDALGLAVEDLACARYVYERAVAETTDRG